MTIETALYPTQLNATLPPQSDIVREGAGHLRLLKTVVKTTFPNLGGAWNATQAEANYIVGVTSPIQVQINSKGAIAGQAWTGTHSFPSTTTVGPLTPTIQGYLSTATSDVQAQINSKGAITGQTWTGAHVFNGTATLPAATTIGAVTAAELAHLSGVTSPIQTQFAAKASLSGATYTGAHNYSGASSVTLPAATSIGSITQAELGYVDGVTAPIQAQINSKAAKAGDTYTGAHNYTGATITVPTLAAGSSGNSAASVDYANALAFTSALPAQAGNAGKFVKTNGTTANWSSITFAELASKPTTISGYGITNAVATSGDQAIAGNKSFSGNLLVNGGALGYGVGAGGTVVQATSKTTQVTLNKSCGEIITHAQSLAPGQSVLFDSLNTFANECVCVANIDSSTPEYWDYKADAVAVANGRITFRITSLSAVSLASNVVINFALFKIATT